MAADVMKLSEAETLMGQKVMIDSSNGVKVDTAMVTTADVEASN